jgi:hypothetical protein
MICTSTTLVNTYYEHVTSFSFTPLVFAFITDAAFGNVIDVVVCCFREYLLCHQLNAEILILQ